VVQPAPSPPLERRSLRFPQRRHDPARFLTQSVLEFLQQWFGELDPSDKFFYSDDPDQRQLLIADRGAYLLEDRGRVPAVVVKRGRQSFQRQAGIDRMVSMDLKTGRKVHADLQTGSVTIHCFCEARSLEAEELGSLIFEFFNCLDDRLRKYGMFQIRAAELGVETQVVLGAEERILLVPLTIVAQWSRAWATQENAPTELVRGLVNLTL
jgi:hypothetical protein